LIKYSDLPKPEPKGSHVLVKVGAVAVNPIDTYIRNGANYWELPKPFIIGCDLAGKVEAVGPEAKKFKVGDRVWGSNQGLMGRQGTFAEYCVVDECWLHATPVNVNDETAAACALVGITAHLGLFQHLKVRSGETLFVNGGTGGVGAMVIQMAKAAGLKVFATAGSPEKIGECRSLGADEAVNYKTDDIATAVKNFAPQGFHVYWETTRDPDFDKIVSYLAERGRIVLMAGREARPPFPVGPFYVKGCSLCGFVMFKATAEEQLVCGTDINRWLAEGKLKPKISRVLSLSEAAAAHQLQEDNTLRKAGTLAGKIVLKP
jgi:NADPH2:quinone reductase